MQKKLAILSFLILLFLLVLTGVWALFIRKDDTSNDWKTLTEDNITLTYQYVGVNVWKYNVKGQLPNPCHSAQVDALVAESYPEQVTVKVNIVAWRQALWNLLVSYEHSFSYCCFRVAPILFSKWCYIFYNKQFL